jgi:hypothetical protein
MMIRNRLNRISPAILAFFVTTLSLPALAELEGPPEGRQQLVDALDAAWVRALDEGQVREIINRNDANDFVINIADCLPDPHVTRYPEEPIGTLKRILDEQRIKVGVSDTGKIDEGSTAFHFTNMGDEVINALLTRIAEHYGSGPIEMVTVKIPPPFLNTTYIDSGKADILGLVNALGGSTKDDKRRRKARRYTCTMTATPQFIWMLKDGGPDWQNIDDALNARDVHFCAGPLSNELTKTYFDQPGQTTKTEFVADLAKCLPKLVNGKADAMINPMPHERFFPEFIDTDGDGKAETATAGLFRVIDTRIVAGTPLWVAVD